MNPDSLTWTVLSNATLYAPIVLGRDVQWLLGLGRVATRVALGVLRWLVGIFARCSCVGAVGTQCRRRKESQPAEAGEAVYAEPMADHDRERCTTEATAMDVGKFARGPHRPL